MSVTGSPARSSLFRLDKETERAAASPIVIGASLWAAPELINLAYSLSGVAPRSVTGIVVLQSGAQPFALSAVFFGGVLTAIASKLLGGVRLRAAGRGEATALTLAFALFVVLFMAIVADEASPGGLRSIAPVFPRNLEESGLILLLLAAASSMAALWGVLIARRMSAALRQAWRIGTLGSAAPRALAFCVVIAPILLLSQAAAHLFAALDPQRDLALLQAGGAVIGGVAVWTLLAAVTEEEAGRPLVAGGALLAALVALATAVTAGFGRFESVFAPPLNWRGWLGLAPIVAGPLIFAVTLRRAGAPLRGPAALVFWIAFTPLLGAGLSIAAFQALYPGAGFAQTPAFLVQAAQPSLTLALTVCSALWLMHSRSRRPLRWLLAAYLLAFVAAAASLFFVRLLIVSGAVTEDPPTPTVIVILLVLQYLHWLVLAAVLATARKDDDGVSRIFA